MTRMESRVDSLEGSVGEIEEEIRGSVSELK